MMNINEENKKMAEENKHISTETINQDIIDTEQEIVTMEREIKGFRLIGDRMSHFRADAREDGIKERKEFVENLKAILEARRSSENNN